MKHSVRFLLALMLVTGVVAVSQVSAASYVVSPSAPGVWAWSTYEDNTLAYCGSAPTAPAAFSFGAGPDTPPLGSGSYQTTITECGTKVLLYFDGWGGMNLSDVTALSYSVYSASDGKYPFYINIYLDTNGDTSYDVRMDYQPPLMNTGWSTFDALAGSWNTTTGMNNVSVAAILAAYPTARILPDLWNVPGLGAVVFNMGDRSSTYVGFDGALDNVTLNGDVYDFEPDGTTASPSPIASAAMSAPCYGIQDGRVNDDIWRDCAAPVAVYPIYGGIQVYGIDPSTADGWLTVHVTPETLDAVGVPAQNTLLGEGTIAATGQTVQLYRLTTGEYSLFTQYWDSKPYIIVWDDAGTYYHVEN